MIFLSLYYWRDVVAREYGIEESINIEMMNQLNSFFLWFKSFILRKSNLQHLKH